MPTGNSYVDLTSILGGSLLQGLLTPKPKAFTGSASPQALATGEVGNLNDILAALTKNSAKGINLKSSYVQTPTSYKGGSLPMTIGVSGQDPAAKDASLRSLPGIDFGPQNFGSLLPPGFGPGPNGSDSPGQPGNIPPIDPNHPPPPPIGEAPDYPDPNDYVSGPDQGGGYYGPNTPGYVPPPSPSDLANGASGEHPAMTALKLLQSMGGPNGNAA